MKLIDYKCEVCGNVVEDWDHKKPSAEATTTEKMQSMVSAFLNGLPHCCDTAMTPQPWMNNQLPTCGVK